MVPGTAYTLTLRGLKDTAPGGNVIQPVTRPFNARNIVYAFDAPTIPAGGVNQPVSGLPVLKTDHWTMNVSSRPIANRSTASLSRDSAKTRTDRRAGVSSRFTPTASDFWFRRRRT